MGVRSDPSGVRSAPSGVRSAPSGVRRDPRGGCRAQVFTTSIEEETVQALATTLASTGGISSEWSVNRSQ
jgi:hypothetical protein